jgi:hypothetical protein
MVRGILPDVSDQPTSDVPSDDAAPVMFKRQSDVPDPMPSVRHGEYVSELHREWIRISTPPTGPSRSPRQRLSAMARKIGNRVPGGVDQVIIADLIRAVDAVAARCDELSDRLQHQQIVLDDAVTIFGEELTRIRAELAPRGGDDGGTLPPPALPHE